MPALMTPAGRALLMGAPQRSSLLTSLAAYWALEEASGTRADSLGVSNLTDNNTVTQAVGKVGNAAQFTAANSEDLSITDNTALSMGDIAFTIAGWFNLTTLATMALVAKYGTSSFEYRLDYAAGAFRFLVSPNGAALTTVTASSVVPATATWYFIVADHDPALDLISIQVNNGTVHTAAHATGVFDGTASFAIGALLTAAPAAFLNGLADEVGVWKRLLTTAERTAMYNGGAGRTYPFTGA